MAQAIPITPQQKIVRTATNVGGTRWSSSSSASQSSQTSSQNQYQATLVTSEISPVYQSNIFVHSMVPAVTSSQQQSPFDRTRIASATIPRQQKPVQQSILQNQSMSAANGSEKTCPNESLDQRRYPATFHGQSVEIFPGRRRSVNDSMPIMAQQDIDNRDLIGDKAPAAISSVLIGDEPMKKQRSDHFRHITLMSTPQAATAKVLSKIVAATGTPGAGASNTTMVVLNADNVVTSSTDEDGSTTVTITGLSETVRSSPVSDTKWTSFEDSEGDGDVDGDEASSRHHSESEHQNLLADIDATSDCGDDTTTLTGSVVVIEDEDPSLVITPSLRTYYEECFEKLRQEILVDNNSSDLTPKGRGSTDLCSSPPMAASSPTMASPMAIWGKHPRVKEFFERSNLNKNELGQIWALADVNTDGWLNVDEFCIAMHLVVRCVQAGLPVPELLPAHLRPPVTPPISTSCSMPSSAIIGGNGGFWTQFDASGMQPVDQKLAVSKAEKPLATTDIAVGVTASVSTTNDLQNALSPGPVVLKDFTNVPPASAAFANVAQPKARRVTPELFQSQERQPQQQSIGALGRPMMPHHSSSAPPNGSKFSAALLPAPRPRTSTNDSTLSNQQKAGSKSPSQVVTSPSAAGPLAATIPKGPPPKPPPRPLAVAGAAAHRHSRSVSLDLSKKITDMQQQFTMANVSYQQASGAPTQDYVSPSSVTDLSTPGNAAAAGVRQDTRDAQVQTMAGSEYADRASSAKAKRNSTAPMLDLSLDLGDETPRAAIGGDVGKTPPPRQSSISAVDEPMAVDEKDWTKRCARLRRLNADLEQELRKLGEERVGLEMHFKRLEKL